MIYFPIFDCIEVQPLKRTTTSQMHRDKNAIKIEALVVAVVGGGGGVVSSIEWKLWSAA